MGPRDTAPSGGMEIPHLDTQRLLMREFGPADLDRLAEMLSNPQVMRFMPGGRPVPRERAAVALNNIAREWQERGYGRWAVIPKVEATLIGWCGLGYIPELDEIEVLYLFDQPYWGRGFATEAARASVRHGFETLRLERIIALAVPENIGSRRVMEKLGMTYERACHLWDLDLVQYAIAPDAFSPKRVETS
jgi:RimJ/RimL family protein N-acetyltransferase